MPNFSVWWSKNGQSNHKKKKLYIPLNSTEIPKESLVPQVIVESIFNYISLNCVILNICFVELQPVDIKDNKV